MNALLAVLWKDLLTEWRSRGDRAVAMLLFSMLMVVIFHFSLPGGATTETRAYAPGLLWVAYVFAALLGLAVPLGPSFGAAVRGLSGILAADPAPAARGFMFGLSGFLLGLSLLIIIAASLSYALVFFGTAGLRVYMACPPPSSEAADQAGAA